MTSSIDEFLLKEENQKKNDDDDESVLSSSSSSWGDKGVRGKRGGKKRTPPKSLPGALPRSNPAGEEQPLALQTSFLESDLDQLIAELTNLGFDVPAEFVGTHSPDRIRQAIARAKSLPNVKNLPGLVRYLVTKPGPIPKPQGTINHEQQENKYIHGKYGHLVRR